MKLKGKEIYVMTKLISIVVGIPVILLTFVVYMYFTPHLAFNKLKDSTRSGDIETVKELIDTPVLKENIKSQLQVEIMKKMDDLKDNPFAPLALVVAQKTIDAMVDVYISPEYWVGMWKNTNQNSKEFKEADKNTDISYGYKSFSKFIVTVKDKNNENRKTDIVLTRYSLFSWKVTNVIIPTN